MGAVINTLIPSQSFEVVREKLCLILTEEFANQQTLGAGPDVNVSIWKERFNSFDKTEMPAVDVMLAAGTYDGQTQLQADGTYLFYIDCYAKGITTDAMAGDTLSMLTMQKIAGMVRAIIQDSRYRTLGFTAPFVMSRQVKQLDIQLPQKSDDAQFTCMGRITLSVKVPEIVPALIATELQSANTKIKVNGTSKGYLYELIDNY